MTTFLEKEQIKKTMDKIQGWASHREGYFLYETAKRCSGRGVIVEIGSWKGKTTAALGLGSLQGNKVAIYAIDPHTGSPDHQIPGQNIWTFDEFKKNILAAGVAEVVKPIIKTAAEAAKNWGAPIELLYLDVNYHSYELSKKDFLTWTEKLIDGGIVVVHNTYPALGAIITEGQPLYGWPGPRKMLNELVFGSTHYKNIGIVGNSTYAIKCVTNTLADKIKGRCTQLKGLILLLLVKLYRLLTHLPSPLKKWLKKSFIADNTD